MHPTAHEAKRVMSNVLYMDGSEVKPLIRTTSIFARAWHLISRTMLSLSIGLGGAPGDLSRVKAPVVHGLAVVAPF